jgi:steroid delta-isomerase-like uncharacterized protein
MRGEARKQADAGPGESSGVLQVVADYLAARNAQQIKRSVSLFAADSSYAEFGGGSVMFGKKEICRYFAAVANAVPDLVVTLTAAPDITRDCVLLKWTIEGTHKDEFAGVPGSGKRFKVPGSSALFFRGRQILRALDCFDAKALEPDDHGRPQRLPRRVDVLPNEALDPQSGEDNVSWGE